MDATSAAIVIIALFALVAVAAFLLYRRADVRIKGPWGTGLDVKGSNEDPDPRPGVNIEDAKSHGGGLLAEDKTGRGAHVSGVEVQDDILASSEAPDTDPKA